MKEDGETMVVNDGRIMEVVVMVQSTKVHSQP